MKTNRLTLTLAAALALPASLAFAQRPGGPPPGGMPPPPPPPQQQGDRPNQRPSRDPGDPRREPLPPPPLEHALDTDDDGIISATEIDNSPEALAKLDKNKDGKLSPEELRPEGAPGSNTERPRPRNTTSDRNLPPEPFPGQRPPRDGDAAKAGPRDGDAPKAGPKDGEQLKPGSGDGPKAPPLINALDVDHDGVISAAEIADAPKALLTLDKNNDGQLGPKEIHPRPPGEGQGGEAPVKSSSR